MFSERFFRNYKWLLVAALILMMIPILWAMFYVRPVLDDLYQPLPVMRTWRETGSLIEMFKTVFEEVKSYYMEFSGIFFTMFLSVLPLSIYHDSIIFIHVMLLFFFLMFSLYTTGRSILRTLLPDISRDAASCAGLLLCIMVLLFLPSYREGIFWYMGTMGYSVIFGMALLLFTFLLNGIVKESKSIWRLVVLCIGFFCIGAANWVTPTMSIVVYAALGVWIIIKKKQKRYLIPFFCMISSYLISIAAPGNVIRTGMMNQTPSLVESGVQAMVKAYQFAFSNGLHYVFLLLFLPVGYEAARHASLSDRYPVWVPAVSWCVLGANYFPFVYKSSYWSPRHSNSCFLLLAVLLVINVLVLIVWATKRCNGRQLIKTGRGMLALGMTAMVTIGLMSVTQMNWKLHIFNCTLQPASLIMNLIDGSIERYAQDYDDLAAYVAEHAGEDIVITPDMLPENEFVGPHEAVVAESAEELRSIGFAGWWGGEGTTIMCKEATEE